jgi:hypothetical protein
MVRELFVVVVVVMGAIEAMLAMVVWAIGTMRGWRLE